MKLILENVGSGFQTFGRGEMSAGPVLGMTRASSIQIDEQTFRDYYLDICYYHTKKAGEVKARLRVDGEVAKPEEVLAMLDAQVAIDTPPPEQSTGPLLDAETSPAPVQGSPIIAPEGLIVNHNGPVDIGKI